MTVCVLYLFALYFQEWYFVFQLKKLSGILEKHGKHQQSNHIVKPDCYLTQYGFTMVTCGVYNVSLKYIMFSTEITVCYLEII